MQPDATSLTATVAPIIDTEVDKRLNNLTEQLEALAKTTTPDTTATNDTNPNIRTKREETLHESWMGRS